MTKLSIKNWSEDDQPREKMLKKGRNALSNAELITILIGTGTRNKSALELSQDLLHKVKNNLHELGKLSVHEIMQIKGLGPAKAVTIAAALELGRRRKDTEPQKQVQITCSADSFEHFSIYLQDLPHEEFWFALLNKANQVIETMPLSKGGVDGTVVDVKLICQKAIEKLASGVIISHNHPSGNLNASNQDKQITQKLKEALKLFDIVLLDHIIIASNNYVSFADEGML